MNEADVLVPDRDKQVETIGVYELGARDRILTDLMAIGIIERTDFILSEYLQRILLQVTAEISEQTRDRLEVAIFGRDLSFAYPQRPRSMTPRQLRAMARNCLASAHRFLDAGNTSRAQLDIDYALENMDSLSHDDDPAQEREIRTAIAKMYEGITSLSAN